MTTTPFARPGVRSLTALALVAMLNPALVVRADTVPAGAAVSPGSPLGQYLESAAFKDELLKLAKRWDRALSVQCDQAASLISPLGETRVLKPVDVPAGAQAPVAGVWQQRFTVQRCGQSQVYNAYVAVEKDKPLHVGALLPGLSNVDPLLAREALNNLMQSVKTNEYLTKGGKACLDFGLTDTRPTPNAPATGTGHPGRFEELWTVFYCGKSRPTPMCFTPNAEGKVAFVNLSCADADKKKEEDAKAAAAEAAASAASAPAPASAASQP